jgi:nucleoside-diphosphate-sugar epimerase
MAKMEQLVQSDTIIGADERILVTGATGFIGIRVVRSLLGLGFRNVRCFSRPSSPASKVQALLQLGGNGNHLEMVTGNLLSRQDCKAATEGVSVIVHLAAARGEKSIPDAFMNSVVTTRNLMEAGAANGCLKRIVNISSFSVYSNRNKPERRMLDENCPVDEHPELRGDAYTFVKVKQDEILAEYAQRLGVPYVIVRPGYVFGPGNPGISGRVGIGTFGIFLHLGGSNKIPLTYVDNCAEAIALAAVKQGIDGEVFNVVDDDLPTSRKFLRLYKKNVRPFRSIYIPHFMSYALCYLWERYSEWSLGQLPSTYNRWVWHGYWKKTRYSNNKLKSRLQWSPRVPMMQAMQLYFESCRGGGPGA